jgi:tetratricopeptide (TPR) repeat protein
MARTQKRQSGSTNESFILEKSKDLLKKGNDYLSRGNETEALNNYSKAISYLDSHKDDISAYKAPIAKVYNDLALGLIKVNKQNEAMRIFDKSINLDQNNVDAWIKRGEALTEMTIKMYDSALKSFNTALNIEPTNKDALGSKGSALEKLNQPEMAKECYMIVIDNYPDEFEFYDRILKLTPLDETIWERKGEALNAAAMYEEALTCYDKALEFNPEDIKLLGARAWLFSNLEMYDDAISGFKSAIEINENDPTLWKGMGFSLHKKDAKREALEAYERALSLDGKDYESWNHKAAVLFDMQKPDEALAAYETASNLAPDDVQTLFNMLDVLKALKRNDRIIEICDKIISLEPGNIQALNEVGSLYLSMENNESALEFFERALEIDSKDLEALVGKKDALMNIKNFEEVNNTCDKILKIDSENVRIWEDKAVSLVKLDKPDIANSAFDRALKIEPENLGLWIKKKEVLTILKRYADVINAIENILKQEPENIGVLLEKGEAFENLDRFDEALEVYDEILKSNPNEVATLQKKGSVLYKKGLYEESLACLERTLDLEKGDKTLWNDKGLLLFKLEKFQEADESYSNALNLDDKDVEIWLNKSLVLFKLNNFDEAMEAMDKVIALNSGEIDQNEIVRRGITVELKVLRTISEHIEDKDHKKEGLSALLKAKEALKKDNYEKAHEFCVESKGVIEGYTKDILENADSAVSDLKEMAGETTNFEVQIKEMKTHLAERNYETAFPLSEKIKKEVREQQYKIVSSFFNNIREELKDAKKSKIDISKQLKNLSVAKETAEKSQFKDAYDMIVQTQNDLHLLIEKNKEFTDAIELIQKQLEDAKKGEVDVSSVEAKVKEAKDALNNNEFEIVSELVAGSKEMIKQLTMEHTINEKIAQSNELINIASSLDMATEDAESQLKKTQDLLRDKEFENAENSANLTLEMAEKLCNLKIMEILTQIRSRITEVKKMGLEAVTTEVLYKRTEEALMLRRYAMAAKYASLCINEIEEIRDESQRAANIILLARTYIHEAENIYADVKSPKMLLEEASSELEENQYTSSLEDGNRCINLVKKAKEQRVMDIITRSRQIIETSKNEGNDVFNAEMLLKEAEIVIGTEDYFKALKLALMGENEIGQSELQRKIVPDIVNRIDERLKEADKKGIGSKFVGLNLKNAREALKNREFIIAYNYAILANKELSEMIRDYEKASISLHAASARIHEVESIGVDLTEIRNLFERAKKEFEEGNHSEALTLVKETIENSKQLYKEYLLKPIENCEELIITAKNLGGDVKRANNILLEAKAAFEEELFSQVPLFIDNCKKIVEREIKGHLFEKLTTAKEKLDEAQSRGLDTSEAMKMLKNGESSLENKKYLESMDYLQKCLDGLDGK